MDKKESEKLFKKESEDTPIAIDLVNKALEASGIAAQVDYKEKTLLMLIIDGSMKLGYLKGTTETVKEIYKKYITLKQDEFRQYLQNVLDMATKDENKEGK